MGLIWIIGPSKYSTPQRPACSSHCSGLPGARAKLVAKEEEEEVIFATFAHRLTTFATTARQTLAIRHRLRVGSAAHQAPHLGKISLSPDWRRTAKRHLSGRPSASSIFCLRKRSPSFFALLTNRQPQDELDAKIS